MSARTSSRSSFADDRGSGFWINALVGVVAAFAWSMLPLVGVLAPLVGGAVAGYLQNTGRGDGLKVGAVVGLVGTIPIVVVIVVVMSFLGVVSLSEGGLVAGGAIGVFGIVALVVVAVTNTAVSAAGGFLGASMADG